MPPRPDGPARTHGIGLDAELITLVRAPDCRVAFAALRALYLRSAPQITRWVEHLNRHGLLCQPDIDDFLQDAYALLLQAVFHYDPRRLAGSTFWTFLEHVIARRFHNYVRARRRALGELRPLALLDRAVSPRAIWPPAPAACYGPVGKIEADELLDCIDHATHHLSAREQYVLQAIVAGQRLRAMAAHLRCSERT